MSWPLANSCGRPLLLGEMAYGLNLPPLLQGVAGPAQPGGFTAPNTATPAYGYGLAFGRSVWLGLQGPGMSPLLTASTGQHPWSWLSQLQPALWGKVNQAFTDALARARAGGQPVGAVFPAGLPGRRGGLRRHGDGRRLGPAGRGHRLRLRLFGRPDGRPVRPGAGGAPARRHGGHVVVGLPVLARGGPGDGGGGVVGAAAAGAGAGAVHLCGAGDRPGVQGGDGVVPGGLEDVHRGHGAGGAIDMGAGEETEVADLAELAASDTEAPLAAEGAAEAVPAGVGEAPAAGLGAEEGGAGTVLQPEQEGMPPTAEAPTENPDPTAAECQRPGECFTAETLLWTRLGLKPVLMFRAGDRLLSRPDGDPDAPVQERLVQAVFVRTAPVWELRLGGRVVRTTASHPFWVRGKGSRTTARLEAGDELAGKDGEWTAVEAVTDTGRVETVYNVTVAEYHTYFVGGDGWGFAVWAHNYEGGGTPAEGNSADDPLQGSQDGAEKLRQRADQLFNERGAHGDTVAVIKGRNSLTGEERHLRILARGPASSAGEMDAGGWRRVGFRYRANDACRGEHPQ